LRRHHLFTLSATLVAQRRRNRLYRCAASCRIEKMAVYNVFCSGSVMHAYFGQSRELIPRSGEKVPYFGTLFVVYLPVQESARSLDGKTVFTKKFRGWWKFELHQLCYKNAREVGATLNLSAVRRSKQLRIALLLLALDVSIQHN
jgi:hypothetical protein